MKSYVYVLWHYQSGQMVSIHSRSDRAFNSIKDMWAGNTANLSFKTVKGDSEWSVKVHGETIYYIIETVVDP